MANSSFFTSVSCGLPWFYGIPFYGVCIIQIFRYVSSVHETPHLRMTAFFNPLLHKKPNAPTFWMHLSPEYAYLLNAYDAKKCQGWFIIHDPNNFVTNRCRATPNTSPDSPLDGESGEMFGFAPHLFVTKFLRSWVMNQPWRILASYAFGE